MILFEEAEHIVVSNAFTLGSEQVELNQSLGRILATDIKSDMNMPPFDKSAMDGFACRKEDIRNELEVIETITAGMVPRKTIGKNQCAKIMTGGMIPEGADCVLIVEEIEETGPNTICYKKEKTADNICYTAEDVKTEDIVLTKGTLIKPQHIAILASVGAANVSVSLKPKVCVLSTGSELVEPASKPNASQIRNSNGYQLYNQVLVMGADPEYGGIVEDDEETTYAMIDENLAKADVVLLTGGVSMGDFDFVPDILEKLNAQIHFKQVAIQPGKPVVFAQVGKKFIFALPGNPVSCFTTFELFVKPFLYKLMGHEYQPLNIKMPFGTDFRRKKVKRKKWMPVVLTDQGTVKPLEYHGSAHIYALEKAHGMVCVEIGKAELKKGELVHVRQF